MATRLLSVPNLSRRPQAGHPSAFQLFWDFPFDEGYGTAPINRGIFEAEASLISGFTYSNEQGYRYPGGLYCDGSNACGFSITDRSYYYHTPIDNGKGVNHTFFFRFLVSDFQGSSHFVLCENINGNTGWICYIESDGSIHVGSRNSSTTDYGDAAFRVNGTIDVGKLYVMNLTFFEADWGTNVPQCFMQLWEDGRKIKQVFQTWASNDWPVASSSQVMMFGNWLSRNNTNRAKFYLGEVRMSEGRTFDWQESIGMKESGVW